jgi:hypothetical protein
MLFFILSFLIRIIIITYLYLVTSLRNIINLDRYKRIAIVNIRNS